MKALTYIDSGVLISAVCGEPNVAEKAMVYLDDPNRDFASSIFVKLEVLPKAIFHKSESRQFYEHFFSKKVAAFSDLCDTYIQDAFSEAVTYDLAPLDALHISSAKHLKAVDFVTSEKSTKPMFRTKAINIISIHS